MMVERRQTKSMYNLKTSKVINKLLNLNLDGKGKTMLKPSCSNYASSLAIEPIWQNLPYDLIQEVLAKLAIPYLFQAQVIDINTSNMIKEILIGKSNFKQLENEMLNGVLVFQNDLQGSPMRPMIFNPSLKRCHVLPNFTSYLSEELYLETSEVIAASEGLICFANYNNPQRHLKSLCACNPLTKTWYKLPLSSSLDQIDSYTIHLIVDKINNSYKVVLLSLNTKSLVYSSNSNTWKIGLPYNSHFQSMRIQNVASYGGFLHALVEEFHHYKKSKIFLLTFDFEKATWLRDINTKAIKHLFENCIAKFHDGPSFLRTTGTLLVCFERLYIVVPWSHVKKSLTFVIFESDQSASKTQTSYKLTFQKLTQVTIEDLIKDIVQWEYWYIGAWFAWREDGHNYIGWLQTHTTQEDPTKSFWLKYNVVVKTWTNTLVPAMYKKKDFVRTFLYNYNWINIK